MNTTFELIKLQIMTFLIRPNRNGKGNSKILLAAIPFFAMLYCSFIFSNLLLDSLDTATQQYMPYIMCLSGVVTTFVLTVNIAQGQLFEFKDFELLMSLPISRNQIFIAKLVSFMAVEYGYSGFFILPAFIIYGLKAHPGIMYYVFGIIGFFFLTLIPIVLACLIAMLIKKIAGNSKYKSLINNIATIVMVVALYSIIFSFSSKSDAEIIKVLTGLVATLKTYLPFAYYYVASMLEANILYFLLSISISALVYGLYIFFFSKSFITINQETTTGFHVKNFKLRSSHKKSIMFTLFDKELKRFLGNFMYVFNQSFGMIILIVGAAYLVIKKDIVLQVIQAPDFPFENPHVLLFFGLLLIAGIAAHMSCISGVTISLEGKHLWITKSLPVKTMDVFISKMMVNFFTICIPSLIALLIVCLALGYGIVYIGIGILYILCVAIWVSSFGLIVNLHFPKLDFDREIVVIKQSMSSFISLFGSGIFGVLIAFFFINICTMISAEQTFGIILAVYIILDLLFILYLQKKGTKLFEKLF